MLNTRARTHTALATFYPTLQSGPLWVVCPWGVTQSGSWPCTGSWGVQEMEAGCGKGQPPSGGSAGASGAKDEPIPTAYAVKLGLVDQPSATRRLNRGGACQVWFCWWVTPSGHVPKRPAHPPGKLSGTWSTVKPSLLNIHVDPPKYTRTIWARLNRPQSPARKQTQ
mmetsp:Transcript_82542/g.145611  ORF Transcript_82542/g.145611 Transcript_82542/m.145611 type:complete len:167 (-) Transcript_82542:389-889(-)